MVTNLNHIDYTPPLSSLAVEEQAIDRVHRIGQQKDVVVKRFIIQDSVEERILELQGRKRRLASTALNTSGLLIPSPFAARFILAPTSESLRSFSRCSVLPFILTVDDRRRERANDLKLLLGL